MKKTYMARDNKRGKKEGQMCCSKKDHTFDGQFIWKWNTDKKKPTRKHKSMLALLISHKVKRTTRNCSIFECHKEERMHNVPEKSDNDAENRHEEKNGLK